MLISYYTQEELTIAKEIVFDTSIGALDLYKSDTPVGILLGGQPASGKTGLIRQLQRAYSDRRFVVINGDEYRQYHPRCIKINEKYGQDAPKYTQPFSNELVEYLKDKCLRLRLNFIIEGTMRSFDVVQRTAMAIKNANFLCEAHTLAVAREDSLLGIFQRFEGDKQRTGVGRFSPIDVHDEAYRQIPVNLAKAQSENLFDRIVAYTRQADGQLQIGLDTADNQAEPVDFVAEFERLRQPIFSKQFYQGQWLALGELAQQRGETSETYRKHIEEFVRHYL